jgi:hypothetical protein
MPVRCDVPEKLLASLGISNAVDVLRSRDYFVVLPNEEAVRNAEPDYTLMKELDTIGVIVTAKGHTADVVSRCFYPGAGIPEDPVTGSAHCNIVPYWSEKLGKTTLFCQQLSARGADEREVCSVSAGRDQSMIDAFKPRREIPCRLQDSTGKAEMEIRFALRLHLGCSGVFGNDHLCSSPGRTACFPQGPD